MFKLRALALVLLFLPACASGLDDDPIAAGTQPLLDGSRTTVRPEIFETWTGCTATLISPEYVITAGHCLSPAYTGVWVDGNTSIFTRDRDPVEGEHLAVDRIHSFGTRGDDRFDFQGLSGVTDVALLHLAEPIPAERMTPAGLSPDLPPLGTPATIFGFGCNIRDDYSTGGVKRYFSFDYGPTATNESCAGDSGGPSVLGRVLDGGAVYAVTSGHKRASDVFGIAAYYKPQIEKIIRDWDGGFERGFNRQGMDYQDFATADAGACAYYCRNDGRCRSFTWTPSGMCWLKDGTRDPTPAPGYVSGVPPTIEIGMNRNGSDYANFVPAEPRAELCGASCARDSRCAAWTYVAPSGGGTGMCWLKTAAPYATPCSICTSGVMERAVESGYDRGGADLDGARSAPSARACGDLCARDERCRAYTWTGGSSNNCWLKGGKPWARPVAGWASGVRAGLQVDRAYDGPDYRSFGTKPVPGECQAACARDPGCQAWSFQPPPPISGSGSAICHLKSTVPTLSPARGCVAGIKGMEMMP